MTSSDESIVQRLNIAIAGAEYPGPIAEAEIAAAEAALGVRFPTSFRIFLAHFGAVWLPSGFEVAGLGTGRCTDLEPPRWQHVVDVTEQTRRTSRGNIPKDYIRVSDDGGDFAFYIDTGQNFANGECPVVILGPGRDNVIIAHSFVEFVEKAVSDSLNY